VRRFVAQTGVTFPIGWDDSRSYSRFRQPGGISPFPLQVVVGRDGRIAYISNKYDNDALVAVIKALLQDEL
jgi:hypothetical protein